MRKPLTSFGLVVVATLCACQGLSAARRPVPRAADEADLSVYLDSAVREQPAFSLEVSAVLAISADGREVPLEVVQKTLSESARRSQRLLAWGRVPRGEYVGLAIAARTYAGSKGDGAPTEPAPRVKVAIPFVADARSSPTVALQVDAAGSAGALVPAFQARIPARTAPDLAGLVSVPGAEGLAVFDGYTHQVTGGMPLPGAPAGVALNPVAARVFVALPERDEIATVDLVLGVLPDRIRLRPGDAPTELALTPGGALLLSVNAGSNSVSFIDPKAGVEVGRAPTGLDPGDLVVDGLGQRAYVCNRGGSSVTVLDVAARTVVGSIPTDARPLSLRLDRTSSQLYVVQGGSLYLAQFALPQGVASGRLFVGAGATWVEVDPRTNRLFVARGDVVQVYEPLMQMPMMELPVGGNISRLQYSARDASLLAVIPSRSAVAVIDTTSWRVARSLEVGASPFATVVPGGTR